VPVRVRPPAPVFALRATPDAARWMVEIRQNEKEFSHNYMDDKAGGKRYCGPRQGDAPLSALGEEAVFKRQQYAVNQLAHLMQRYSDRLPFEAGRLGERYIDGRLKVCLKLRSRLNGKELHFIFSRCNFENKTAVGNERGVFGRIGLGQVLVRSAGIEVFPVLNSDSDEFAGFEDGKSLHGLACSDVEGRNRNPVFFVSVKKMEGAEVRVPSRVCMGVPDELFTSGREELYYFSKLGVVCVDVGTEGEGNSGGHPSKFHRKYCKNVVEGVAQIGQNVANCDLPCGGQAFVDLELVNFLSSLDINIGNDFVWLSRSKLLDFGLELVDFGFGPFGLGVTTKKRFSIHDVGALIL
jgi:hypothetical protein